MRRTLWVLALSACSETVPEPVPQEVVVNKEPAKERLTPEQYRVCVLKGTEPPGSGKWLYHKEKGSYLCAVCSEPLFSSETKFESGTGWPSFFDELAGGKIKRHEDRSLGMVRVEILCAKCGSHLGHVFDDGPDPTGQRYCVNSLSLDFAPEKK